MKLTVAFALTIFAVGLFLLTGCSGIKYGQAHELRLKIIDAKTDEPLPGVSVIWREDHDGMLVGSYHLGPSDLPPADANGVITIPAAHEKMVGRLILSLPGYVTMYGVYSGGSLDLSRDIQPPPFPQDLFELDDPQTDNELSGGNYVVRMPK